MSQPHLINLENRLPYGIRQAVLFHMVYGHLRFRSNHHAIGATEGGQAMAPGFQLRLALVLFGGVSLAVYVNGMTQEILALVRAAHARRLKAKGRLNDWVAAQERENPYYALLETAGIDLEVDVIAGTSAGGLNGLLLAKALAVGAPDISVMTDLWLEVAQIDQLATYDKTPTAMLSGLLLEKRLKEALGVISDRVIPELAEEAAVLDLFVPATDVRGHKWDRQDEFGETLEGIAHKYVFHLKKRTTHRRGLGYEQNDLAPKERDPVLARIGRATSAFPGAFPPVRISRPDAVAAGLPDILADVGEAAGEGIWFADGGILLNKPFEPVLDALQGRHADGPVKRVLAYLEPDPERVAQVKQTEPHLLETAAAGLLLPMSQDIADSLTLLQRENQRRRDRQHWLTLDGWPAAASLRAQAEVAAARQEEDGQSLPWQEYRARLTRLRSLLSQGLEAALKGMGLTDGASHRRAVQAVIKVVPVLREDGSDRPNRLRAVARFLARYDLEYHVGRIRYQMAQARHAALTGAVSWDDPAMSGQVAALRHALELWLSARWALARAGRLGACPDRERRRASALDAAVPALVQAAQEERDLTGPAVAFAKALARYLKGIRSEAAIWELQGIRPGPVTDLLRNDSQAGLHFGYFAGFFDYAAEGEESEIGLCRLSPTACSWVKRPAAEKIAGEKAGHFAAFFSRRWRANDIMWGRLDGAELLTRLIVKEADLASATGDDLCEEQYPEAVRRALEVRRRQILAESPEALDLGALRGTVQAGGPASHPAALSRPSGLPQPDGLPLRARLALAWGMVAHGEAAAAAMPVEAGTAFILDPATPYERLRQYLQYGQAIGKEGFDTLDARGLAGEILLMIDNAATALARPAASGSTWVGTLGRWLLVVVTPLGWVARLLLLPRQGLMATVQKNLLWLMGLVGTVLLLLQASGALALGRAGWLLLFLLLLPHLIAGLVKSSWMKALLAGLLLLAGAAGAALPWLGDGETLSGAIHALRGWSSVLLPLGRLLPGLLLLFVAVLAAALFRSRLSR